MRPFSIVSWVAVILVSASPTTAQPPNGIERSIMLEGRRLAAGFPASAQAGGASTDAAWVPVRMVPAGSNVEVGPGMRLAFNACL